MTDQTYKVGLVVENPKAPQWGPGKILAIEGRTVTVYFRDFTERKRGDAVKKISLDHVELAVSRSQSDPMLDNLPAFSNGRLEIREPRLTLKEAIDSFCKLFPRGFNDPKYISDSKFGEREYKW